jgi:CRISPR/Cas system-associated exonuclease Cas4 (RecB family)
MQKFVDTIAKILSESKTPLKDWVIIIPSERAKQYVLRALFDKIGKAFFAPKIYTINNWINIHSNKVVLDKTRLLLNLYQVHLKYPKSKENLEKFDEFLNWGNILLSDFDEIERYLVDSKQLFKNLRDVKDIENWSFNSEELSENQKKYLEFWERLPFYYEELKLRLEKQGACFPGEVYKILSQNIDLIFKENKNSHFIFAGFNALSLSEMSIFKQIYNLGRAEIVFDSDAFYLNDFNHEAGQFIRKFQKYIGKSDIAEIQNNLLTETKNIELISCSQLTGQVKVVSTLLENKNQEELNETLVLLADETLILPLIQNIPKSVSKANITIGLPLKSSALSTWVDLIFNIQEGFIRYNRVSVYHKDLLTIWNHPFVHEILNDEERKILYAKEKEIRKKNIIFQSSNKIKVSKKLDLILELLYTPWKNSWEIALKNIRLLNLSLFSEFQLKEENILEKAIIQRFDEVLIDFQNCVSEGFPEMSLRSFKMLFQQEWTKESVAYYGNPIDGLQIMGLLETRLLDFKNIIVLGLNEGKMPPTNPIQTLIPMDLRRFFELPLPRDKQGLFAHHFYRLLHKCENLTISYHNGAEGIGFSEKSRYITQLELELIKANPSIKLVKKDYTLIQEKSASSKQKSIVKTPELILKIDELLATRTSVSMIKNYFECPLDFYYKYLLKFGEEEKVEEEMESNSLGTIIHGVLEDLYQDFNIDKKDKNVKNLMEKDIDLMLLVFRKKLHEAFKKHFNGDEDSFMKGKNFLSYSMAIELCEQFLKSEKKFLKENPNALLYIKGLEQSLETEIEITVFEQIKKIKLKGFIDRIDLLDGNIRIIDYKTGKVTLKEVDDEKPRFSQDELEFLVESCKKTKHFFQLMTYIYLYYQNHKIIAKESAIISFVNFRNNPFVLKARTISNEKLIEYYPLVLQKILEEIYDINTNFEHKTKAFSYCNYC